MITLAIGENTPRPRRLTDAAEKQTKTR